MSVRAMVSAHIDRQTTQQRCHGGKCSFEADAALSFAGDAAGATYSGYVELRLARRRLATFRKRIPERAWVVLLAEVVDVDLTLRRYDTEVAVATSTVAATKACAQRST
jgi:hypothetical protein